MTGMKTGLIMEGGAMRGMFTCGIIDVFSYANELPFRIEFFHPITHELLSFETPIPSAFQGLLKE